MSFSGGSGVRSPTVSSPPTTFPPWPRHDPRAPSLPTAHRGRPPGARIGAWTSTGSWSRSGCSSSTGPSDRGLAPASGRCVCPEVQPHDGALGSRAQLDQVAQLIDHPQAEAPHALGTWMATAGEGVGDGALVPDLAE